MFSFALTRPAFLISLDLPALTRACSTVPWIAMIFVRQLAAARVAHRATPSGFVSEHGADAVPGRARASVGSLLLRLLRRDQEQPLDLASRVPQGLIDV